MRRRDIFRDPSVTAEYTRKLGTRTARAMSAVVNAPDVTFLHHLALIALAHHADLMTLHGDYTVTYPNDVADIMGCTETAASRYLQQLKRWGFVKGSAAAGYTLVEPEPEQTRAKPRGRMTS